jgi:anti-sigma factor RsiW
MKFRDVELISTYLDGQTSPSDSSRLKARLQTEPELASAYQALRESRALLRQLPHRRAPRNFTLTPKMVGQKPPLPRAYPVFRFATALATILFALSFIRFPSMTFGAAAPAPAAYEMSGAPATEPPATEAPLIQMAPASTETPFDAANLPPTALPQPTEDAARIAQPTAAADAAAKNAPPSAPEEPSPFPLSNWQITFGGLALLGAASMFGIRRLAANTWRGK